jgi:hypothetical protein
MRIEVRQENNKEAQLASLEKALKILKRKIDDPTGQGKLLPFRQSSEDEEN